MTTIHRKALAPAREPYRKVLLLTHKNGDTRAVDLDWGAENGSSHRFSCSAWIFFMLTRHFLPKAICRGNGGFMLIT